MANFFIFEVSEVKRCFCNAFSPLRSENPKQKPLASSRWSEEKTDRIKENLYEDKDKQNLSNFGKNDPDGENAH